jgi:hypothetical protein
MVKILTSALPRRAVAILLALFAASSQGLNAATDETFPAAPTLRDAHQYFESLVAGNDVAALYETRSRNGDILGFQSFPVENYWGRSCETVLTLKNGVKVDIDWAVSGKSQFGDGTLSILQGNEVHFRFFHMLSVEGGITVEPSTTIGRLIFGINDELSRNRLAKAIDLVANACRSKSKFD